MNFHENHLSTSTSNIELVCILKSHEEKTKPRLFITYIFKNSKVFLLNNIHEKTFVKTINDIEVSNIDDLKKALKKPFKIDNDEYIKVENDKGNSVILSIKDANEQDNFFSKIYGFPLN
jgi:hypothetical protein